MLIRSQDKKQLLNLDNGHISIDFRKGVRVLFCGLSFSDQEDYTCIGEYSTEEKAIKVLNMVQNAYEMSLYSDHAFDQSANVMRPYLFVNNRVFQMPADEEDFAE